LYNPTTNYSVGDTIPMVGKNGATNLLNVTQVTTDPYSYTFSEDSSELYRGFNFTIGTTSTTGAEIRIYAPWFNWHIVGDENNYHNALNSSNIGWDMNVIELTDDNVTIEFRRPLITIESLISLTDLETRGWDQNVKLVNVTDELQLAIYNSNLRTTADDLDGRYNQPDTIALVNKTDGSISAKYGFGENIPAIGKSVVRADQGGDKVYLSTLTVGGYSLYPLPHSCDEDEFFAVNFTETSLGMSLSQSHGGPQQQVNLSTDPRYMVLYDDRCNGVSQMTTARYDDDHVLDDRWTQIGEQWGPYDFTYAESPESEWDTINMTERWINIGQMSNPFAIVSTELSSGDGGAAMLFKQKSNIDPNDLEDSLTLWVKAKEFDGSDVTGNVSVDSVMGMTWGCMGQTLIEQNISASTNLTDGQAFLPINLSNATANELTIKAIVSSATGGTETIETFVWYHKASHEKEMCSHGPDGDTYKDEGHMDMMSCDMMPSQSECTQAIEDFGAPCEWDSAEFECAMRDCDTFTEAPEEMPEGPPSPDECPVYEGCYWENSTLDCLEFNCTYITVNLPDPYWPESDGKCNDMFECNWTGSNETIGLCEGIEPECHTIPDRRYGVNSEYI